MFNNNPYSNYPYQSTNYGVPNYSQRPYLPSTQQMPQNMQQIPMQPQPQMQYEIPIQDVRFVTSEEAKAYIVMPNSKALLIDKNGMAYLKTADNMGQSQTQYFRFEAVTADGSPIKPQEPTPQVDFNQFIKKEDLENLGFVTVSQYNELAQKLEHIQKQIMGGRQNVGQSKQSAEARV